MGRSLASGRPVFMTTVCRMPRVVLILSVVATVGCRASPERVDPPAQRSRDAVEPSGSDPYAASEARLGTIKLHAGFNPDPHTVTGTALGEIEASTLHPKCRGWISSRPDYLMHSQTAFYRLHILARSTDDIVLVVRKPDGKIKCNDDRGGRVFSMVKSAFPIGTSQIWVGVKDRQQEAPYRLGFSEVKWQPSILAPL